MKTEIFKTYSSYSKLIYELLNEMIIAEEEYGAGDYNEDSWDIPYQKLKSLM